jgi:hypothetical protein
MIMASGSPTFHSRLQQQLVFYSGRVIRKLHYEKIDGASGAMIGRFTNYVVAQVGDIVSVLIPVAGNPSKLLEIYNALMHFQGFQVILQVMLLVLLDELRSSGQVFSVFFYQVSI